MATSMAMIWVMILLGNLINIGYKMSSDLIKEKTETNVFKWIGLWLVKPINFFYVILGVLCSIAVVLTVDFSQIENFMYDNLSFKSAELVALMIGFLGQWVFKLLVFNFKKEVNPPTEK